MLNVRLNCGLNHKFLISLIKMKFCLPLGCQQPQNLLLKLAGNHILCAVVGFWFHESRLIVTHHSRLNRFAHLNMSAFVWQLFKTLLFSVYLFSCDFLRLHFSFLCLTFSEFGSAIHTHVYEYIHTYIHLKAL